MGPLSPSVALPHRGPDEGYPRRAAVPTNFIGLTRHIMPPTNQAAPVQQGTTAGAYTTFPQSVRGGRGACRASPAPSTFGTTRGGRTASQPSQATAGTSLSDLAQTAPSTSQTTRSGRWFGKRAVRLGEQDQASDADDDDDDDDDDQYRSDHEGRSRPTSAAPTRPASPLPPMDESYTNSANEYLAEHGASPLQRHEESRLFRRARERAEPAPPGRDHVEGFEYPAGLFDADRQARPGNDPFTWPTPNITTTASIDPVTGGNIIVRRPGQLPSPRDGASQPEPPSDSPSRRQNEDLW